MNALDFVDVGHAYLGRTVLDGVRLSVRRGEVVALVGPSGCGKSTLLHIGAGLLSPVRGRAVRAYRTHGVVFQEPRLMPWATAIENIGYPLRLRGTPRRERRRRAEAVAAQVALSSADLDKYPVELSGGMRQRVAVARALSVEPDFIFLDEPFSALDVGLKRRLQDLTLEAIRASGAAALFVTHDLMEAARMADRLVTLDRDGRGLAGQRALPGRRGVRTDREVFDLVQAMLIEDPMFSHLMLPAEDAM